MSEVKVCHVCNKFYSKDDLITYMTDGYILEIGVYKPILGGLIKTGKNFDLCSECLNAVKVALKQRRKENK